MSRRDHDDQPPDVSTCHRFKMVTDRVNVPARDEWGGGFNHEPRLFDEVPEPPLGQLGVNLLQRPAAGARHFGPVSATPALMELPFQPPLGVLRVLGRALHD